MTMPPSRRSLGFAAALAAVVANIIGTGVFTTLGLQVQETTDGFALLALWGVGGLIALTGALSYGEISAAIGGSGGEYRFLGRIYHPTVGAVAGWVSVVAGFAAPVALAAMALGRYAGPLIGVNPQTLGVIAILGATGVHLLAPEIGGRVQVVVTSLKVLLIVAFIVVGVTHGSQSGVSFAPTAQSWGVITSGPFALSLIFVSYAYSGFNAAAYFQAEVIDAERTVPRAMVTGTALVVVLYVALIWMFLRSTPMSFLAGQVDVGAIVGGRVLGDVGGRLMSGCIAVLLVSTISAMTLAGPRSHRIDGDEPRPATAFGTPERVGKSAPSGAAAGSARTGVCADGLVRRGAYVRRVHAHTTSTLLTVAGVILLREREPDLPRPYHVWGYPYTPLFFAAFSLWTLIIVIRDRPMEAVGGEKWPRSENGRGAADLAGSGAGIAPRGKWKQNRAGQCAFSALAR